MDLEIDRNRYYRNEFDIVLVVMVFLLFVEVMVFLLFVDVMVGCI